MAFRDVGLEFTSANKERELLAKISIIKDLFQLGQSCFSLLPAVRRYRRVKECTTRLRNISITVIRLLNILHNLRYCPIHFYHMWTLNFVYGTSTLQC